MDLGAIVDVAIGIIFEKACTSVYASIIGGINVPL